MKLRRLLTPSVAAALAVLGLAGSATSAHAGDGLPDYWAVITTDDHVGVYWQPYDTPTNKVGLTDDSNEGSVLIDCWVSAGQVGTAGDVWYRTWKVNYPPPGGATVTNRDTNPWWTFAPYVNGAWHFHNHIVPQCS
jgi:hypothetical protein